jgi:hypothetical protein
MAEFQWLVFALNHDHAPPAEGAAAEDLSGYGFEWNFADGSKLWFDIDAQAGFSVFYKPFGERGRTFKLSPPPPHTEDER